METLESGNTKFWLTEHMQPGPPLPLQDPQAGTKGTGRMVASGVAVGIMFQSQTVVGVLANSFLLLHYLFLYFTGHRERPTDLILKQLIVSNLLTLLCKGVPQTIEAFSLEFSLGDIECKLLFYVHRVSSCMTIGSTCLVSAFQAITSSPRDSCCSELKVKAPRYIGTSLCLSCILYMLINIIILMYMENGTKQP